MPTSPYVHIQTFVDYLIETKPTSLLDIGLGNGKLGFVARDLLDVMLGQRHRREQWQVRIDGIEIFGDYIQNHQKDIYDHIYIGNALDIIPHLEPYEMIVIGDVLEHFEKDKGWQFLELCASRSKAHLILNIPLGDVWQQPEMYGNPYEEHRSVWTYEELEPFVWKYKLFDIYPGQYGSLLIRRQDYAAYAYEQYMNRFAARG